ncbi:MAG TPA: trypsin-like serine protease [Fimbriimonadaceae bacterium]|nr:trypsin-like serine protease [Fimbriimonadaceae bacterium]
MRKGLLCAALIALAASSFSIFPNNAEPGMRSVGSLVTLQSGRWTVMGSGVAIAPNWVLTVAHTTGTHFQISPSQRIPIVQRITHTSNSGNADLALLKLGQPVTTVSKVLFANFTGAGALKGKTCRLVGFGLTGVSNSVGWQITPNTTGTRRWAQNVIDAQQNISVNIGSNTNPVIKNSKCLLFDLDRPNSSATGPLGSRAISGEGGIADKDSGSPMFVQDLGEWKVVAINALVGTLSNSGTTNPFAYGGVGYSVWLQPYAAWIRQITGLR